MKIFIIGGAGSGKTYAANKLTAALKIKNYELDKVYWHEKDTNFTKYATPKQRAAKVKKIVAKPSWIVEGAFTRDWVKPFFKKADIIIIISCPRWVRVRRFTWRWIKRQLTKKNKENISALFRFFDWNKNYEISTLPRAEKLIKKLKKKAFYFKKADKAIAYVLSL